MSSMSVPASAKNSAFKSSISFIVSGSTAHFLICYACMPTYGNGIIFGMLIITGNRGICICMFARI